MCASLASDEIYKGEVKLRNHAERLNVIEKPE